MPFVISFHTPSQNNPRIGPPDVTISDSFQLLDHLKILCYFKGEICVLFGREKIL